MPPVPQDHWKNFLEYFQNSMTLLISFPGSMGYRRMLRGWLVSPKVSLPHHLGLLGASKDSGPRFQHFNPAHRWRGWGYEMKMIVTTVMRDHQIVQNMIQIPFFLIFGHARILSLVWFSTFVNPVPLKMIIPFNFDHWHPDQFFILVVMMMLSCTTSGDNECGGDDNGLGGVPCQMCSSHLGLLRPQARPWGPPGLPHIAPATLSALQCCTAAHGNKELLYFTFCKQCVAKHALQLSANIWEKELNALHHTKKPFHWRLITSLHCEF